MEVIIMLRENEFDTAQSALTQQIYRC